MDEGTGERYRRERVTSALSWACVAVLCIAYALFSMPNLRAWTPSTSDPISWLGPCAVLVAQVAILHIANRTQLRHASFRGNASYMGAFAAGVCAAISIGPSLVRLAVAFGTTLDWPFALFLSGVLVALNAASMTYRAESQMTRQLQGMVVAAGVVLASAAGMIVLTAVPAVVVAGTLSAGALAVMHIQPNLLVQVPDEYLLEWQRYMTQRWTVRGVIPRDSRPLLPRDVDDDLGIIRAKVETGTMLALAFSVAGFIGLCATMPNEPRLWESIGFVAYVVLLSAVLLLKPRTAGSPVDRMAMRAAAVIVLLVALAQVWTRPGWRPLLPYLIIAAVAVGVLLAAVMLALASDVHSILLSRIGDWLVALGLGLSMPAMALAVGAMDVIRGLMS